MALVIGNAAYAGEKPLRNPGNDAQDVAAALQRAGVTVQRHTNLGRTEMNRAIDSFMQASEGAELAIIYYSGHGMQASGEAFLIPIDAKIQSERDVRSEGVRLGELMDDLEARRIRNTLLIIDACRDNPYRTRTKSSTKGLARPKEMNGAFLVAYATADGTTADDGDGRNGKYTEQLLKQLGVPGKSLRDVVEDTQLEVEKSTGGAQRPKNYGDTAKFRSLSLQGAVNHGVQIASARAEPTGRPSQSDPEEDAWQATKAANSLAAYDAFLSEFPKGRYAGAARIGKVSLQEKTSSQQLTAQSQTQRPANTNTSAGTLSLEWSLSDNGADINWSEATKYCTSKGSSWRLPTIAELQSVYDPTQTTSCGPYPCHAAQKLHLTGPWFWSNESSGVSSAFYITLTYGDQFDFHVEGRGGLRALCVRRS